ncbi:cbb3-type cytochrome oxidase assembly protein CcoS [Pedobacter sp. MC2016-14]|uniref:cbb3-type cytochrome oxidase assembly protein CcoS n=1 Tax=Pedobacter sp. MC2016-14 TaxID=2897327 RepID=UPI001E3A458D|nr:cbb3-type cytochrome oxidase assembly protein CcoS [Pedobacter sp. MC2016-14]MCD0489250.1 cbb3-type cytochrome oxidase assembly protein CcoS [Pedobacter sp. MC2016-14]
MNMIFLLIGLSIFLALMFLLAFFWASRTGQNDDTCTPAIRILFEDTQKPAEPDADSILPQQTIR